MGDSLRAFAVGRQAAVDVEAATLHWLSFFEDFQHRPNIRKDVPKFKINHRWMERVATTQTRFDEVTVRGRLDSTEIGWLLVSAFGPPVSATNTHTFTAGSTQVLPVTGTNSMLLTVAWMEGLTNLWWKMVNAKVNTLNLAYDATGNITFEATLRGVQALPATSPPVPSYTPPPDNSPFNPWQTVLSRGGTALCLVTARFNFTQNIEPFYCSPVVAPTAGMEHGLFPKRFTDGETTGTYDITYEYLADAASSFYNFRHDVNEAWTMEATDPDSAATLGYTPGFLLTLPKLAGTSGDLDRSRPNVLQNIRGSILFDTVAGYAAEAVLTNGLTAYTAT